MSEETMLDENVAGHEGHTFFKARTGTGGERARLFYKLPTPPAHYITQTSNCSSSRCEIFDSGVVTELIGESHQGRYPHPCSAGLVGLPGVQSDQRGPDCTSRCPSGYWCPKATFEPKECPAGFYCEVASMLPSPCSAGTYNRLERRRSHLECRDVPAGYYASRGSKEPILCPSGYTCPGARGDLVNDIPGSQPIQLTVGTIRDVRQNTKVYPELVMTLTANADIETVNATKEAMQVALASSSGVSADDIMIDIQPGSVLVKVSFVLTDGNSTAALEDTLAHQDAVTLSELLAIPIEGINLTRGVRNLTTTDQVEKLCQPGHWCTAGTQVDCEVGFYNPHTASNNQSACIKCPDRASTRQAASTDVSQCLCEPGYYNDHAEHGVNCATCPSGTNCSQWGATMRNLPIRRGFYRHSDRSANVWPCPEEGKSACKGTIEDDAKCFEGTDGVFCQLCVNSSVFYQRAVGEMVHATCMQCGDFGSLGDPINVLAFLIVVAILVIATRRALSVGVVQTFVFWVTRVKVQLKVLISLYQIIVRISTVYEIDMPSDVMMVLRDFDWALSFGLKGMDAQFECLKWGGYVNRIRFWVFAPALGSMAIGLIAALVVCCRGRLDSESRPIRPPALSRAGQSLQMLPVQLSRSISSTIIERVRGRRKRQRKKWRTLQPADDDAPKTVLETALPPMLWLLFFAYPLVANSAFAAFPCYDLDSGRYLRADVSIECDSAEHSKAQSWAILAIFLYPIGLPLVCSVLLMHVREAILSKELTPLSRAIAFLWREFKPDFFWYEVVEMFKRVLLVGLMQLAWQGQVLQILLGTLLSATFLLFQLVASPYADVKLNFVASIASFCLVVFFLMCVALKYVSLTETADISDKMSEAQHEVYTYNTVLLTALLFASTFSAMLVAGAMTAQATWSDAQRILGEHDKLKRRELRRQLELLPGREADKKVLIEGLHRMDRPGSRWDAANHIFGQAGLHPMYWGVSKDDLVDFRERVRIAVANGQIQNFTPSHLPQYPQDKFEDSRVGPNMHMVNASFIKPLTLNGTKKEPLVVPGLSYALMRNYATGGLLCDLFVSHAWDEGVYELVENALRAWPDSCTGAYICCLSNPQNLDIGKLVGSGVEQSPFGQVLNSGYVKHLVMLANSNTPIHSRLWCVFEAFQAQKQGVRLSLAGEPIHLLTGKQRDELLVSERGAHERRKVQLESVKSDLDAQLSRPELVFNANAVEARFGEQMMQFRAAAEEMAAAKLKVIESPDGALIDLEEATCSFEKDAMAIFEAINGCEEQIATVVVGLVRDVFCGVGDVPASATHAPGSLNLSLVDHEVDLSKMPSLEGSPLLLLQFTGWLRLRPRVQTLLVAPAQLTSDGVRVLRNAVEEGLLGELDEVKPIDDVNGELNALTALAKRKADDRAQAKVYKYEVTFEPGPFGMSIARDRRGALMVDSVEDGGQAMLLGVRPHSVVLEISGESVASLSYEATRNLVLQAPRPLTLVLGHATPPARQRFYDRSSVRDLDEKGGSSKQSNPKRCNPIGIPKLSIRAGKRKETYPNADLPPSPYSTVYSNFTSTQQTQHRASMSSDQLTASGVELSMPNAAQDHNAAMASYSVSPLVTPRDLTPLTTPRGELRAPPAEGNSAENLDSPAKYTSRCSHGEL